VSKAALIAYAEALSLEIDHIDAAVGITVACPAAVATNLAASLIPMEGTAQDAARAAAEGLAKGMAPQEAARRILAAVEEGRFAVFTHAGTEALVEERIRSLINGQDPTDPDWSRFPAAG
jgi:short-subunit dehydrogenase